MWNEETRQRHNRDKLRYPSDLTDGEWSVLGPLVPPAKRGGRDRKVDMREVANGALYVLSTGCQWRAIPKDLPPRSTVHGYYMGWERDGTLKNIHHALYQMCREKEGREASPTACIVDSQSVKSAEKGGKPIDPKGYDAGKKVSGIKRHLVVDTQGLLLHAIVHTADIQDRDGGALALSTMFGLHPFLKKVYADGGYQGPKFREALAKAFPGLEVEIVKRSDTAEGFEVLPRRWVVERTIAWLNRCRRLSKDFECRHRSALAAIRLASIRLMVRKLCNSNG